MAAANLEPTDFPEFFRAIQTWTEGHWDPSRPTFDPFPWQARLVQEIAGAGRWPDLLDLPTGSGKTAAIDVAVFHLALQADWGERRRAAMRIAFVVDRRLVVDEAFERARRLAAALVAAEDADAPEVMRRVTSRLKSLAGDGRPPLVARSLRGGAPREDDWARTPCQPTVLCSTVDQVGSRLLFRGYGVADRAKSIHAGLLGSDALILLDEAHLSQPFRETARAIATEPSLRGADAVHASFQVALLTATPGESSKGEWRFALDPSDRDTPILAKRIGAAKPVTIFEVAESDEARAQNALAQTLGLVEAMTSEGLAAPVIGVVFNRIARARRAFDLLKEELGDPHVSLVIGRSRPVDRDRVAGSLDAIRTGAGRPAQPFVVVATQTLEAGVDIDLDALVTDAAALDSLRQRFGRVNRAGRDIPARGVILADKADRNRKKSDHIYGGAVAETLAALFPSGAETVDFGVDALDATLRNAGLTGAAIQPLLANRASAPILMPAHVNLWTQTSPVPQPDPDTALFLHGPDLEPASVQLVWRADLLDAIGGARTLIPGNGDQAEQLRALLALAPPLAGEAIELSAWAARRWLAGEQGLDLADVAEEQAAQSRETGAEPRAAFRWKGADDERSVVIAPGEIRPGDMIVVPSLYGGCDRFGWAPETPRRRGADPQPTPDVFEDASKSFARRRYVVRVSPWLIRQAVFEATDAEDAIEGGSENDLRSRQEARSASAADAVRVILAKADQSNQANELARSLADDPSLPRPLRSALAALEGRRRRLERPAFPYVDENGESIGVVFVAPFGINDTATSDGATSDDDGAVSTEDDEAGSFTGRAQSLAEHSSEVEAQARLFASAAGLSAELVSDLALAGWLHDAGKADPRFQRLLFDGDMLAMEANGARAKSARGRAPMGAWARANLPEKWRHEALSVRLALLNPRLHEARDRGLVLWLVGVHHGLGRPFFPHEDKADDGDRDIAAVKDLTNGHVPTGRGPQSLGFIVPDEMAFAARDGREADDDLRGMDWHTLFRALKRRYGPWGLARLEAVLRLADHRASEAARDQGGDGDR